VQRDVQGVQLLLPWSHRLPDHTKRFPLYGTNVVALARFLGRTEEGPLQVVDVGANVGDTALQILAEVDARVLCIEGDAYWKNWLVRNVGEDARVTIGAYLLSPSSVESGSFAAVRALGTTTFRSTDGLGDACPSLTVRELRQRHAAFDRVRLIKSDTDGFDTTLIPELAAAYEETSPVLFFEYDPGQSRRFGVDNEPEQVFERLGRLNYSHFAYWSNYGDFLGMATLAEIGPLAACLNPPRRVAYEYWDVAAVTPRDQEKLARFCATLPPAQNRHRPGARVRRLAGSLRRWSIFSGSSAEPLTAQRP